MFYIRNIVINLRFNTNMTRRLGLDNHICELQLILKDFCLLLVLCLEIDSFDMLR